ncbi:MAG: response regulator [Deltaproteobacteria bacterium]|nr:response regulator [Deltaproteobacteria bacterium]
MKDLKKAAIVDDEPSERFVLRGLLEERGWEVVGEGADGKDALKICVETRPDVLIMDVNMPGKDGIQAAGDIHAQCPTPIVLLTGKEDENAVKLAAKAGVKAYLVKPVREDELFAAIELAASQFMEFERLRKENIYLKNALETRKVVERAKGLLMKKEKMTEEGAYSKIQKISMDRRISMKEVAEIIISTLNGEGPQPNHVPKHGK